MSIRDDFPIFKEKDIAYLDSAATSQKPASVIEAVENYYKKQNANPHRGAYELSIESTNVLEGVREKVANFINARHTEEIIFSKNATECLNLVAYSYGLNNLSKDDEVVSSIMEHHSNLVPWQIVTEKCGGILKYLYINDDFEIPESEIKEKITNQTKIVAITHVSNVTGTINNIKEIIKYAHKKGAIVVVDATQSIAHMKIDVQDLDADFLIFSGHKMLASLGVGILYGKRELLNKMNPFLFGGSMIEYVYEQKATFAPLPQKFEAGTQDVGAVASLGAAIDYINSIGYEKINQIDNEIVEYALDKLSKLEYVTIYKTPNKKNHSNVISFNINGIHPHDVASILDQCGVCIRSGNHCAQPLMRFLGIDSTCRASFYIYNTEEDVDKLVAGIKKVHNMFEKYINK